MGKETDAEMIARVLTRKGGHVLVVGGGINDMELKHPQIICWDEQDAAWERRQVPSNTRFILWNRAISHAKTQHLHKAAKKLHAVKYPMLHPRQIRELLSVVLDRIPAVPPTPAEEIAAEPHEIEIEKLDDVSPKNGTMRKPRRGEMLERLPTMLEDGVPTAVETRRLLPILTAEGIRMTSAALSQAIVRVRSLPKKSEVAKTYTHPSTPMPPAPIRTLPLPSPPLSMVDDFSEAERLLRDAQAAITLFLEFIPRLRSENAVLKERQAKMRELLGD